MTETDRLNEKLKAAGLATMKCDVCGAAENLGGVACVPGAPVSVCYCIECLKVNAHPWWILIAGTATNGGYDNCGDFWKEMIDSTITRLNKTREEFDKEVILAMEEQEKLFNTQENLEKAEAEEK